MSKQDEFVSREPSTTNACLMYQGRDPDVPRAWRQLVVVGNLERKDWDGRED